ncbi:MAG: NAD(P)H-dependent glycerol-3-phosphate dehydrogenase [Halieaceae bacterium MED-G27]|nr:NAD(P)H-dependent glycerol-3-phosphate dehydrogenase [Halieaceae bacterium]OUT65065.1 MAG: NAD(P)H-dependent glycerol-3-phosphate dehydrogenase [Cellvibrionales bacterium TMED21]PDH37499.1 MAG: NAD(P)H-dependent glycerol-3-phosphate dehydrogenase [Halieaceae bacterium MED-G27]|tara:strand:+ start:4952 stop:5965 length:1014 start_codon:yes stop_codon:yes gene_type:complete
MGDSKKWTHIAVIGGGSWGTTLASLLCRNARVTLWARDTAVVDEINQAHRHSRYLGDLPLNKKLKATNDLETALVEADAVLVAIPSHNFRAVLESVAPHIAETTPIISMTKGLEATSQKRMSEIIRELCPNQPAGVLTGPNLAKEILAGKAAASVLALDHPSATWLQPLLNVGLFRVYHNDDVIGCELGGVLKNIIAIAVGLGDGLGAGDNTRAALITRGLAEVTRLGHALGGRPETFAGLTGMGDMIATCTSPQSRNRHVGLELATGKGVEQITSDMHMVAEGVKSAPTVVALAKQHSIKVPICREIHRILEGKADATLVYRGLLRVVAGAESEPG